MALAAPDAGRYAGRRGAKVSKVATPKLVEEIRLTSVQSVLEHLRPSHDLWAGPHKLWGFRGQADVSWRLTPTAFRRTFGEHTATTAPVGSLEHRIQLMDRLIFK